MEFLLSVTRVVHVAAGATALLSFWIPLVVAKGNKTHVRAGWVYAIAMFVAAATAVAAAPLRLAQRPVEQWGSPVFLAYVGLLSFTSCFHGVRVTRQRGRTGALPWGVDHLVPALLAVASVALLVFAGWNRLVLPAVFAPLGLLVALPQLRSLRQAPPTRSAWVVEHLGSMIIGVIGTLTAFLVTNARVFGDLGASPLVWLAPTVVGVVLLRRFKHKYQHGVGAG